MEHMGSSTCFAASTAQSLKSCQASQQEQRFVSRKLQTEARDGAVNTLVGWWL